jgi:hypothetical protein
VVEEAPHEELTKYMTFDHEEDRKYFHWGTYGKDGKGPLKYIPLCELETDHIEAILETQKHTLGTHTERLMRDELDYRLRVAIT